MGQGWVTSVINQTQAWYIIDWSSQWQGALITQQFGQLINKGIIAFFILPLLSFNHTLKQIK